MMAFGRFLTTFLILGCVLGKGALTHFAVIHIYTPTNLHPHTCWRGLTGNETADILHSTKSQLTHMPSIALMVVFSFPSKASLQHLQVRCTTKDAFSSTIYKQECLGWKKKNKAAPVQNKGAWWRFSNFTQSLSSYSPSRSSPPPVCSLLCQAALCLATGLSQPR